MRNIGPRLRSISLRSRISQSGCYSGDERILSGCLQALREPSPQLFYASKIDISRFQDAIEPQWEFRPSAVLNSYVWDRNEIYLNDRADLYLPRGRSLDDSLVHELVHFIQYRYKNVDIVDDYGNEQEAVAIQTWFRDAYFGPGSPGLEC